MESHIQTELIYLEQIAECETASKHIKEVASTLDPEDKLSLAVFNQHINHLESVSIGLDNRIADLKRRLDALLSAPPDKNNIKRY